MVSRLVGAGWRQVARGGRWYELVFAKPEIASYGSAVERTNVVMRPAGDQARFEALLLGEYGSVRSRRVSVSFRWSADGDLASDAEARAAHAALVDDLAADGWHVAGRLDPWYATILERRPKPWP